MFPARALQHFVLAGIRVAGQVTDVGDIHGAGHVVAGIAEIAVENILHDVRAEVADMCKMVHGRAAGIHFDDAGRMGTERIAGMGQAIIQKQRAIHHWGIPFSENV